MKLIEKLAQLQEAKKAIIAANFYNLETCKGIMAAAAHLKQPVILQLTKSSIDYMGIKPAKKTAEGFIDEFGVEAWLHLDHCKDIELVKKCLDEGFDSIMIDASDKTFEQNVEITRRVAELAKSYAVNVEAELGFVQPPECSVEPKYFTTPSEAKQFVSETGVNSLAVAIGSKHGFYKEAAKLDIARLQEIHESTPAFLVLHGGSGIPDEVLRSAIQHGICKINIATETKDIFMRCIKELLLHSEEIDLRKVFPEAIQKVQNMIEHKLETAACLN